MTETYTNPVYGREFPDPFVLKYCGEYWAYCTGLWHDGRCFGVLRSTDLVNWTELDGAMEPLAGKPLYWAPEVSYYNGRFYLYYSVGNETLMEIRVAVSEDPAGPFVDSGQRLTKEDFAIDPHVFQDEDGARYLFYATDFLEHTRIGTGTVVDRLLDPFRLAGQPRPVSRARYDWQIYDPNRAEKGGVRWHTVEGPFVLKHKGLYYEMFSGGNWKNISYGVSYATSHDLTNPDEWEQAADGQQILPILRTIPGQVIGPGHNSVVRGPDNRQLYCVYHRWALDGRARLLSIDPLDWVGERMMVLGPSVAPAPVPNRPVRAGFSNPGGVGNWRYSSGRWSVKKDELLQEETTGRAEVHLEPETPYFKAEVSLRALDGKKGTGILGIGLSSQNNEQLYFNLRAAEKCLEVSSPQSDLIHRGLLIPDFDFGVYHLLSLEVAGRQVSLQLDEGYRLTYSMAEPVKELRLFSEDTSAAFRGFSLTIGWEDDFTHEYEPKIYEWESVGEASNWQVHEKTLWGKAGQQPQIVSKGPFLTAYELVVNARLAELAAPGGGYGIYPAWRSETQPGPLWQLEQTHHGWALRCQDGANNQLFFLPPQFEPLIYQQFRFYKQQTQLSLFWESLELGQIAVPDETTCVALWVKQGSAGFDMVRVTELGNR